MQRWQRASSSTNLSVSNDWPNTRKGNPLWLPTLGDVYIMGNTATTKVCHSEGCSHDYSAGHRAVCDRRCPGDICDRAIAGRIGGTFQDSPAFSICSRRYSFWL